MAAEYFILQKHIEIVLNFYALACFNPPQTQNPNNLSILLGLIHDLFILVRFWNYVDPVKWNLWFGIYTVIIIKVDNQKH